MPFFVHDTLSKQKVEFVPREPGIVRMYNCGPTVYSRPHIGNLRAFLFADTLRRWLEYRGYEVLQVMNITDVGHVQADADEGEDKLEVQARKEKLDPWQISRAIAAQFLKDIADLGVRPALVYPRATQHIDDMLEMIEGLLRKGFAYEVDGNVYFEVATFPRYGQLSGNTVEALDAGARIEVREDKRHPADFALWKVDARHVMKWKTRFGEHGFPGWHIECSAMSRVHLGDQLDIHTGGEDNIFPHHECEIAQSEAFTGQCFSRYWMHSKFLQVDGGKMSKSLGNVYSLDDVRAKGFEPRHLRFALVRGHYRQPLNFTWAVLADAKASLDNLDDLVVRLRRASNGEGANVDAAAGHELVEKARTTFEEGFDDDLNVSRALPALFQLRSDVLERRLGSGSALNALKFVERANSVLGCIQMEEQLLDAEIQLQIDARQAARARKDFKEADRIRDELLAKGIALEDTPKGVTWKRA